MMGRGMQVTHRTGERGMQGRPTERWRRIVAGLVAGTVLLAVLAAAEPAAAQVNGQMTEEEALRLGEEFGIIVGEVDEEIQKELGLVRAQGVVVFEVIGGTPAELAGIKVAAVVKEIDKAEVRNLLDFGRALKEAMGQCGFTVGTYEPADPENQGVGGVINFHLVRCLRD